MVRLFVEALPQLYACCDVLIRPQDVASAARFQNDKRRREHLAWRRIVRRELGREVVIDYNDVGAPMVDTPNIYISVAHGGEVVAVAIADCRVGVDVESMERNFERARDRYASKEEVALSEQDGWLCMLWTAKEALYKLYGERGVELLALKVVGYDAERGTMHATLPDGSEAEVKIERYSGNIVVAVATFCG